MTSDAAALATELGITIESAENVILELHRRYPTTEWPDRESYFRSLYRLYGAMSNTKGT